MAQILADPHENRQLASLSAEQYARLRPHMMIVDYKVGTTLVYSGSDFQEVYFPLTGMLSLVMEMSDGKGVETATIGREGIVGAIAALGLTKSQARVTVQLPMVCARIPLRSLSAAAEDEEIAALLLLSNEAQLVQVRISAGCNAVHHVDARFCRWILQAADRGDGGPLPLTQDFMAEMLGVRRTSITEVASKFQEAGMIRYSRGSLEILDRAAMERGSCECYETLRTTLRELMPSNKRTAARRAGV